MLQKYAPPWCKIYFQVKISKILHIRATFSGSDIIEGNLGVKRPIIWTDGTDKKQSRAKVEKKKRLEEKRSEEKKSEKRRYRCVEKVGKSIYCVFPKIYGSGGSKSKLAKAPGAERLAR